MDEVSCQRFGWVGGDALSKNVHTESSCRMRLCFPSLSRADGISPRFFHHLPLHRVGLGGSLPIFLSGPEYHGLQKEDAGLHVL